jgi:hypothetical protein
MSDFNPAHFPTPSPISAAAHRDSHFTTHRHRTATAFHWADSYFVTAEEAVKARKSN